MPSRVGVAWGADPGTHSLLRALGLGPRTPCHCCHSLGGLSGTSAVRRSLITLHFIRPEPKGATMNRTTMTTALATLAATALTGGAATAMAASADSAAPQTAAQSAGRSAAASDPTATRRAAVPGGPEAEAVRDVSATRINW